MPANLTPQYFDAEERYRKATDDRERLGRFDTGDRRLRDLR